MRISHSNFWEDGSVSEWYKEWMLAWAEAMERDMKNEREM
jgi:hypothetical protein